MAETTGTENVTKTGTEENTQTQVKEPNLVTRVSQVKQEDKGVGSLDQEVQNLETKEQVVEWAKKKEKEWASGYGKKFQELSIKEKEIETKKNTVWTPEKIKAEINKPDFVSSAQQVLNNGSDEPSTLSETEKTRLNQLQQKIDNLEQTNWQSVKTNQDVGLKDKYANYAPDMVDTVTKDLIKGTRQATREDLWKVIDYNDAVQRAYDLGLVDKNTANVEKAGSMTIDGGGTITAPSNLERQKDESTQAFMLRSYQSHTKK